MSSWLRQLPEAYRCHPTERSQYIQPESVGWWLTSSSIVTSFGFDTSQPASASATSISLLRVALHTEAHQRFVPWLKSLLEQH